MAELYVVGMETRSGGGACSFSVREMATTAV